MFETNLTTYEVVIDIVQLGVAGLLAVIMGWQRERHALNTGIRTYPLVAVACCGYALLAGHAFKSDLASEARVLQGILTGIGFIGGGAIIKRDNWVAGTATAATIWNTGAMGAAVAYHRYDLAVALTVITVAVHFLVPSVNPE